MFYNEIVEEIHRVREEYSRSLNYDLKAIFADLQKQQAESGSLSRKPGLTTRWSGRVKHSGENAKDTSRRST